MQTEKTDVVIVGAGLAGLSCAVGLRGLGLRVTVLEKAARVGGRAASWIDPATGDSVDLGPHVLLSEYRNMLALMDALGTRERVVWQAQPLITLLEDGQVLRMQSSSAMPPLHQLVNLPVALRSLSLRDLWSLRRVAWQAVRREEEDLLTLDGLDARSFLRSMGVSEHLIDWFWSTACISLLAAPAQHCSAASVMRFFRMMAVRSGYCFGFPATGLSELFADAALREIARDGGQLRLGTGVRRVELERGGFSGLVLDDGSRLQARWCVCALPPQALLEVLAPGTWPGLGAAARFRPSAYISSYLWFDRKLGDEKFWARRWSPEDLNCDFYDLSNIRAGWQDRPSVIASNCIDAARFGEVPDEEVVRRTLDEIAEFHPGARQARLRHAAVHRVPMAIPRAGPGTERLRPATRTPVRQLLLAGDWTRTGLPFSMESAVRSGWLAAEPVAAELGRPRRLAQAVPEPAGLTAWLSRRRRREPPGAR
ncbi:hydroxysqualene dehydroxylase [Caldimonas tepidiphila]|uniref:hydroxysqualene dehydroxylase n=1 Tax=Caldimonas tepidiphila TaxID=2315841 RepID=UPI000E5AFE16|nr:FAD-dependent oxidoreductase [Caldimonas tepidiphila]